MLKIMKKAMKINFKQKEMMGERGRKWIIRDFSDQYIGKKMLKFIRMLLKKSILLGICNNLYKMSIILGINKDHSGLISLPIN